MRDLSAARRARGQAGEQYAARWLEREGCTILARNYRAAGGEVDIIARDGADIAFVEVRTREVGGLVGPAESVTARKRERLLRAACHYLQQHALDDAGWRIDLVAVEVDRRGAVCRIERVRNVME